MRIFLACIAERAAEGRLVIWVFSHHAVPVLGQFRRIVHQGVKVPLINQTSRLSQGFDEVRSWLSCCGAFSMLPHSNRILQTENSNHKDQDNRQGSKWWGNKKGQLTISTESSSADFFMGIIRFDILHGNATPCLTALRCRPLSLSDLGWQQPAGCLKLQRSHLQSSMEAARSGDINQKAETQTGIPWNENWKDSLG